VPTADNPLPLSILEDLVTKKMRVILNKHPDTLYGELGKFDTLVTASLKEYPTKGSKVTNVWIQVLPPCKNY
jgi:hypothetical protein